MAPNTESKLFIFGWDAADWVVIEEGWKQGRLENLRALADRGQSGTLMSTIPPITPIAFTSFITGVDAGEHGIFGFVTRGAGYDFDLVSSGTRRAPTLAGRLDRAGYRTALVTFPYTYPAEPLEHGIVVPGWDDPLETFDSIHPPEVGRELSEVVPRIPRRLDIRQPDEPLLAKFQDGIDLKERIARWVIDRADPQLFAMVFSDTDHASHRWWTEGDPPQHLVDVYDMVDRAMGAILRDHVREEDTVLVASDHGSRPLHTAVHIAPLLAEGGFLTLAQRRVRTEGAGHRVSAGRSSDKRQRMLFERIDWANTLAFPLGDHVVATGIYLNDHTWPTPAVSADEFEDVRAKVAAFLAQVEDPKTGVRVFDPVATGEELYRGPHVDQAPDLIVDGAPGFAPHVGKVINFHTAFSEARFGGHRREGMFAANADLGLGEVEQVPAILPKVLERLSFRPAKAGGTAALRPEGYTDEEARQMEDRLRELGYLE
jgi:predicted AlkP superfamily phosphohydrolase/phosphomutase